MYYATDGIIKCMFIYILKHIPIPYTYFWCLFVVDIELWKDTEGAIAVLSEIAQSHGWDAMELFHSGDENDVDEDVNCKKQSNNNSSDDGEADDDEAEEEGESMYVDMFITGIEMTQTKNQKK